jgi:hypothetical protein
MPPAAAALATLGGGSALAGGLMVGSGVASAASSLQGNRNQRKQAEKQNEMSAQLAAQRRADIKKYGEAGLEMIAPSYGMQRDVLNQAMTTLPDYYTQQSLPQFQLAEDASMRAQQAQLAGLGMQTSSLLGNQYYGPGLQAQGTGMDYGQLAAASQLAPIDTSAIDNALALQGSSIPGGASGRGSNPNSMNVTPEQRQMLNDWNLAMTEMGGGQQY